MTGRLVLHVGLPKTGTTTVQKHVFPKVATYYGPFSKPSASFWREGFPRLRQIIQFLPPAWWFTPAARDDREFLRRLGQRLACSCNDVLLSFENLIASEFFGPNQGAYVREDGTRFHPVEHLAEILPILFPSREETIVLVTCRRQWPWLPSLYAQLSDRIPGASQRDFDDQLETILESDWVHQSTLNYHHLGSEILRRVLPSQLVFLPMESMGQLEYSTLLAGVLQLAPDEVHRAVAGSRENARQAAPNTWKLRLCAGGVSPGCETTGLQGGDPWPASGLERSGRPSLGQGPRHISLAPDQLERLCALVSDANHRIPEAWAPIGLPGYSFESGSIC